MLPTARDTVGAAKKFMELDKQVWNIVLYLQMVEYFV